MRLVRRAVTMFETNKETTMELQELIQNAGITMDATQVAAPANDKTWGEGARHWQCTLALGERRMKVPFHQGSAHENSPTAADVLNCLASDADVEQAESFEEWASNLGYDADSRRAEKIYQFCVKQTKALRMLLGDELFEAIYSAERI